MEEKKEEEKENIDKEAKKEKEEKKEEEEDVNSLKDKLLRLAAEFDNYKKRVAKEIDNAKNAGKAEVIRKLLPTLDEFEIAIDTMGESGESKKGIELIYLNFISILKSEGLKEIDTSGTYDPYKHEIVLTRESNEKEGTILEVVRKGYMLNDIMLRPSSVIVAKKAEAETK